MILGIVSDTHGHREFTRSATRMLATLGAERVIHCGDIGSIDIVELFASWPTHFVFGNVDHGQHAALRAAIERAGHTCHERFGSVELLGRRLAFLHGDDTPLLDATISGGSYDLVYHGHTHVTAQYRHGATLVVNPGALYRADPHSLATVILPGLEVNHISL